MEAGVAQAVDTAAIALRKAAAGRSVLLICDDVWQPGPLEAISRCLDPQTVSRLVVTTRIQSLVPGATELFLGLSLWLRRC